MPQTAPPAFPADRPPLPVFRREGGRGPEHGQTRDAQNGNDPFHEKNRPENFWNYLAPDSIFPGRFPYLLKSS
jgi:hypothetical protein